MGGLMGCMDEEDNFANAISLDGEEAAANTSKPTNNSK